ncbi:Voltage-gated hydrogen channel 1 [Bulinus truncatus]|nr:Voltage-gated hydrogen channel 1 [Bulinus truncatus]
MRLGMEIVIEVKHDMEIVMEVKHDMEIVMEVKHDMEIVMEVKHDMEIVMEVKHDMEIVMEVKHDMEIVIEVKHDMEIVIERLFSIPCNVCGGCDHSTGNSTHGAQHHHHHTNKEKAEHVLHALSLAILSIFMVEVSLKIFVERTHLLKQPAEVFDAVVVIVSFTLDITFSFVSVTSAAQDAAGLMVLLRLWRVTRIINGVILSVKLDAKKKIDEVKRALRHAEYENKKLKSKVDKLENKLKRVRADAKANNEVNSVRI